MHLKEHIKDFTLGSTKKYTQIWRKRCILTGSWWSIWLYTFDGAPKDALRDLHKNAQKGVCEVALKGWT